MKILKIGLENRQKSRFLGKQPGEKSALQQRDGQEPAYAARPGHAGNR
jgi:hypothetical protein